MLVYRNFGPEALRTLAKARIRRTISEFCGLYEVTQPDALTLLREAIGTVKDNDPHPSNRQIPSYVEKFPDF